MTPGGGLRAAPFFLGEYMSYFDFFKGSLNPSFVFKDVKHNAEFYRLHPDYFGPDGILVFCGPQGSGKTLSAVKYVRHLAAQYPDMILCTNVDIHDLPPIKDVVRYTGLSCFSDISNGYAGVVYLIDEIHLEFNSLESKQIDPAIMTEIAQQRKQRKHIVGTAQVFGRIAKPFREQFKYVVQCRSFFKFLQSNTIIDGTTAVVNDDGTMSARVVSRNFWFHEPADYMAYDTFAKVLRTREERWSTK